MTQRKSLAFSDEEASGEFAEVFAAENFNERVKALMRAGMAHMEIPEKGAVIGIGEPTDECPTGFHIKTFGFKKITNREWERAKRLLDLAFEGRKHLEA